MKHVRARRFLAIVLSVVMILGMIALPVMATEQVEGLSPRSERNAPIPDMRDLIRPAPLYEIPDNVSIGEIGPWGPTNTYIVELTGPTTIDLGLVNATVPEGALADGLQSLAAAHRVDMLAEQEAVQEQIFELYPYALFRHSYTNILNGFAVQMPAGLVEAVLAIDGVLDVHKSEVRDMSIGLLEEHDFEEKVLPEGYFIPLDNMTYAEFQALIADIEAIDTFAPRGIAPRSDQGSWDLQNVREAWDLGFTGAGRVAAVLDTYVSYTHMTFSYMDPVIVAEQPQGFVSREAILQTIRENQDTLNLFRDVGNSWYLWLDRDQVRFSDEARAAILEGASWRSDKVPFSADWFLWELPMPPGTVNNHGTHVAGSILSDVGPNMVNGQRGVAFNAQLFNMGVYAPDWDPSFQESDEGAFAAMDDAITLGAHSFNMSFGTVHGFSTVHHIGAQLGYQRAFNRAQEAGISITVSAGNDGRSSHLGGMTAANVTTIQGWFNNANHPVNVPGTPLTGNASMVGERPTILPNAGTVAFPTGLFGAMTVASNQGGGAARTAFNLSNMVFTNASGEPVFTFVRADYDFFPNHPTRPTVNRDFVNRPLEVRDLNATPFGVQFAADVPVIDIGTGAAVTADLTGAIALITASADLVGAQERAAAAGAVGAIVANTEDRIVILTNSDIYNAATLPVLGMFRSSHAATLRTALAGGNIYVSFTSRLMNMPGAGTSIQADTGPSGFTTWGVTDALRLTPDIMGVGANVLSGNQGTAAAPSDTAFSFSSGTSMSSPNVNGVLLLIQESLIARYDIFGAADRTLDFGILANQLIGSTANVVNPRGSAAANANGYRFFSPRRQGSGMADAGAAVQSNVVLHNGNTVSWNPDTGEAPRNKVELFDNLGEQFEFTFVIENFNNGPRTFDVSAVLQTDTPTRLANGRYILAAPAATGAEIYPFRTATMTVQNTPGVTIVDAASNINQYHAASGETRITVQPGQTEITIAVDIPVAAFAALDNAFPNGMFIEGFVFFESVDRDRAFEDVNIPFMGFRGCWLSIPIFDFATIYDDISDLDITDPEHPVYQLAALHAIVDGGDIVLGVNQFTDRTWWGYALTDWRPGSPGGPNMGNIANLQANRLMHARYYFNNMRTEGNLHGDFVAFSPNGDDFADEIYANLNLLRNVKAAAVLIRNAEGEIVNVIGIEHDFIQIRARYDHGHRHWMPTQGGRYHRDLGWDGTDFDGNIVPDGLYTYEIRAMTEFEYLNRSEELGVFPIGYDALLAALLEESDTRQYQSFTVRVDTSAPVMVTSAIADNELTLEASDTGGIQAIVLFHDGELVGDVILVNATTITHTFDLGGIANLDPDLIVVQAVDFALNLGYVGVDDANNLQTLTLDANGGDFGMENGTPITSIEMTLTYGDTYAPAFATEHIPVRPGTGYYFLGWFTTPAAGGVEITETCIVTRDVARTLYAHWAPIAIDITNAPVSLRRNTSVALNAVVTPAAAPQEIIWTSNNPALATVNAQGVVTARVATGVVVITARTACGQVVASVTLRLTM